MRLIVKNLECSTKEFLFCSVKHGEHWSFCVFYFLNSSIYFLTSNFETIIDSHEVVKTGPGKSHAPFPWPLLMWRSYPSTAQNRGPDIHTSIELIQVSPVCTHWSVHACVQLCATISCTAISNYHHNRETQLCHHHKPPQHHCVRAIPALILGNHQSILHLCYFMIVT